jgi:Rod binding domain-containing protein
MQATALETATLHPVDPASAQRRQAVDTANQFEEIFVRTLVNSLRQTASTGGDGMFGTGPGTDTYAAWFDEHVAKELGESGGIGIAAALLADMERHGEIDRERLQQQTTRAAGAADRHAITAARAMHTRGQTGGIDVVL